MSFKIFEQLTTKQKNEMSKGALRYMKYRLSHKELFADAFSYLAYDGAYAKRNAKNFYNYIIKRDPKLKTIFGKSKAKVVTKIVKTIKKDKKYLAKERSKQKIKKLQEELKKIKSRKRIGPKTKLKIKAIQDKIKKQKSEIQKKSKQKINSKELTWREFNSKRMGSYMKKYGGHGPAIRQIAKEWKIYKNK